MMSERSIMIFLQSRHHLQIFHSHLRMFLYYSILFVSSWSIVVVYHRHYRILSNIMIHRSLFDKRHKHLLLLLHLFYAPASQRSHQQFRLMLQHTPHHHLRNLHHMHRVRIGSNLRSHTQLVQKSHSLPWRKIFHKWFEEE